MTELFINLWLCLVAAVIAIWLVSGFVACWWMIGTYNPTLAIAGVSVSLGIPFTVWCLVRKARMQYERNYQ